jgi:tryptophanyl-tRNA synthetase
MSKSRPAGCLFLDDSPALIREKIKAAVTDSGKEIEYDQEKKPALSNLISIYSALSGYSPISIENQFRGKNYSEFKAALAEVIVGTLEEFQQRKELFKKDIAKVKKILETGNKKAEKIAHKKILEVKKKIGLLVQTH